MLLSLFSCKKKDEEGDSTTVATTVGGEAVVDIDPHLEAIDGDGKVIRVLTREMGLDSNYWYGEVNYVGADMTSPVDSNVVARDKLIEEKYNVKIKSEQINYNKIATTIDTQIRGMATDEESYHIVLPMLVHAFNMTNNGYNYSIDSLKFIDPEKPYWRSDIYDSTTVKGKNYFISGDINTSVYGSSYVCFFNEELIESNGIDDPYEIVKQGEWTIEKMLQLGENFGGDGGDGIYDATDNYTVCSGEWVWYCFMYGSGLKFVEKDTDDVPRLVTGNAGAREKIQDILVRTVNIMNDPSVAINIHQYKDIKQASKLFCDNQVLFYFSAINNTFIPNDIKDMEQEYGVLPLPKRDDNQEEYYNTVHPYHSSTTIVPANISEGMLPLISSILEDLSYQSYLLVKPAYYDNIITHRSIRNESSYEMIPYIFANFNIDFGLIMTDIFGFDAEVRNKIHTNDINFSSYLSGYTSLWNKALADIVDTYGGEQ